MKIFLFAACLYIILSLLPPFDYHQLLLPKPEEAALDCHLISLQSRPGIESLVGYTEHGTIKQYLYSITVVREISCLPQGGVKELLFLYREVYLNISQIDVDEEIERMKERYTTPYRVYRYNPGDAYLLRHHELDRHGISMEPIDIYEDYYKSYVAMKLLTLLVTIIITVMVIGLRILLQSYYNNKSLI